MDRTGKRRQVVLCGLLLVAATLAAFWPVTRNGFINYDDPEYVTENPPVRAGLTGQGIAWTFTTGHAANWHPLTWLSHMADVECFGLDAGRHHTTNLLLHVLNALLLFAVLRRMTGALWRSAAVAGLFALHPAHVQSVAWVAERKDVLSAFFGLLTLLSYLAYAKKVESRKQKAETHNRAWGWYGLALGLFALGLLSKPMLVTLPFVLLLLDFWPLQRLELSTLNSQPSTLRRLVVEKLPFFALVIPSCWLTLAAQQQGGAVAPLDHLTLWDRFGNALVGYVAYLGKLFWPAKLAVYYPYPGAWPGWQIAAATAFLLALTAAVLLGARKFRFLFTGWFWYVGTLVPVIGLVQVGSQAMADRYTYLPFIGLFLLLVWGAAELVGRLEHGSKILAVVGVVALTACAVATNVETRYWRDSETLFRRALAVTRDNALAHFSLGKALAAAGRASEAAEHLQAALRLAPGFAKAHGELAFLRSAEGRFAEAVAHYQTTLQLQPDLPEALNNLAWIRATHSDAEMRDGAEAVRLAERACELTRNQRTIFLGTLAAAAAEAGRFADAVATAQTALSNALLWNEQDLAARNRELLELYRAGKPYREPTRKPNAIPAEPVFKPAE